MAIWRNCCCRMASSNPVRKESLWSLRHFWKPRQVNPLRLKTDARPGAPARLAVAATEVPDPGGCAEDSGHFLDGFRDRDCASLDCQACGYCERIAAGAVSIAPEYRTAVLKKI